MDAGHISPGNISNRSIEDLVPSDLLIYDRAHFFAGIGIWDLALNRAGWNKPGRLWTGSCPCQPFSAAGKRAGADDPRDLWPTFYHLIRVCAPDHAIGEQVASPDGLGWLEGVQASMETSGYAVGAVDTCAAGFADAPGNEGFHIRQRLYCGPSRLGNSQHDGPLTRRSEPGVPAQHRRLLECERSGDARERGLGHAESDGRFGRPDNGDTGRRERAPGQAGGEYRLVTSDNGVDWLPCRDGKHRPVESGTFPLAHEDPQRVGRLCAYGNALDAAQAEGFVRAFMECCP